MTAVTKVGVMSGYRDANGAPAGEFGPGNNVNVAELAKIAHAVAGLSELTSGEGAVNPKAEGWYRGIIGSAEQRGWTIYADGTIDPTRAATRGEVLVTLLQALNVNMTWQTGAVYKDVSLRTPYAAAIETATREGLVAGTTASDGSKTFAPASPINRAELAKMLAVAVQKYKAGVSKGSAR